MGKSTISLAIFNSYFDITRGYCKYLKMTSSLESLMINRGIRINPDSFYGSSIPVALRAITCCSLSFVVLKKEIPIVCWCYSILDIDIPKKTTDSWSLTLQTATGFHSPNATSLTRISAPLQGDSWRRGPQLRWRWAASQPRCRYRRAIVGYSWWAALSIRLQDQWAWNSWVLGLLSAQKQLEDASKCFDSWSKTRIWSRS